MSISYNRQEHLRSLHESRRSATHSRADQAILRLTKAGQQINFNSVAKESGLSKTTLYNTPEIRESIECLRQRQSSAPSGGQVNRGLQDESKDAIIAALKRKIQRLAEENAKLKEQLKVSYGEFFDKL